jgi:tRNA pseudouridine38-40 synthase
MKNIFYDGTEQNGPEDIDWNARFSATSRTYVYRILQPHVPSFGVTFDWDRAWIMEREKELNVTAMNEAARHLIGSHDMSSFRGTGCKRSSPIITLQDISVTSHPYEIPGGLGMLGSTSNPPMDDNQRLILINVTGKSFVYRQVRNIVGCLVEVGRERLMPIDVKNILDARDRKKAPQTAPAAGLFLADVKHGDFLL